MFFPFFFFFFFFNDTATTEIYTLSLHDALPIYGQPRPQRRLPSDVLSGRAFGQRAAEDDVLDLTRLHARALDGGLDDVARHRGSVRVVEGAAVGLADAGARGGYDDGVCHG